MGVLKRNEKKGTKVLIQGNNRSELLKKFREINMQTCGSSNILILKILHDDNYIYIAKSQTQRDGAGEIAQQ